MTLRDINYPKPIPNDITLKEKLFAHGIKRMFGKRIIPRHRWLTYRQMLFGGYYVLTGADGAAAARKAGYTNAKRQAYRLYHNNGVRLYLNWLVNNTLGADLLDLKLLLWRYGYDVHDIDLAKIRGVDVSNIKHELKKDMEQTI